MGMLLNSPILAAAAGGVALDGYFEGSGLSSAVVAVSTSAAGLIVVTICLPHTAAVTGVTATGLTFSQRASVSYTGSNGPTLEVWGAYSSGAYSDDVTVTIDSGVGVAAMAFGLSGVDSGGGHWDADASLPSSASGPYNATPTVTGVSSTSGTFALFMVAQQQSSWGADPAGWVLIDDYGPGGVASGRELRAYYKDFGAPLSSETFAMGSQASGYGWGAAGDVVA